MTEKVQPSPLRRGHLFLALSIAAVAAGTALAFGFQFALSALPDLLWVGDGSPSIITLHLIPDLDLWLGLTLAVGLPSALITYWLLPPGEQSWPRTLTAVLVGPAMIAVPATGIFRLGDGFLFTDGNPLWVAASCAIVTALVEAGAYLLAIRIASGSFVAVARRRAAPRGN